MAGADLFLEDLETGTNGAAVTTGNTQFSAVSSGITYTTATAAQGTKSAALSTGSSAVAQFCQVSIGSAKSLLFAVAYIRLPANPGTAYNLLATNLAGAARANVRLNTDGTLSARNGVTAVWTSPSALPLATWVRVEWKLDATGAVQQVKAFNLHSTTALFDSGNQTFNTGSVDTLLAGIGTAAASVSLGLDWVGLSQTDWVGPAVTFTAPTAHAGPDQTGIEPWSLVTIDGSGSTAGSSPIATWNWTPVGGAPALTGSGAVRTLVPVGTLAGATYTYSLTVTSVSGVTSTADTMTVTVLPAAERIMLAGAWAPALMTLMPFGGPDGTGGGGGGGGGTGGTTTPALTLTVTPEPDATPPRIRIDVADSRAIPATSLTVTRRGPDGRTYPVRTGDGGPQPLSAGQATLYDYEPVYESGLTIATDVTGGPTVATELDVHDVWLIHPGVPSRSCRVTVTTLPPGVRASNTGLHKVLGSENPVPISSGARQAASSVLGLRTYTADEERALVLLFKDDDVLLLNIPPSKGYGWDACYVSVGDLTPSRTVAYGKAPYREWQLPIQVVGRPGGGTQAAITWNTDADLYASWQAAMDAGVTSWAQLSAPTT